MVVSLVSSLSSFVALTAAAHPRPLPPRADACIAPPDYGCRIDAQCCSGSACFDGHCRIPEGSACTSSCRSPEGAACGSMEECWNGMGCIDGHCSTQCGAGGQTSDEAYFCCSGIISEDYVCEGEAKKCIGAYQGGCAADSDCCAGNACFFGACRPVQAY